MYRQAEKDRDGEVTIKNRKIHAALPTTQLNAASTILTATRINTAISPALLIPTVNIKVTTVIGDNEIGNSDNSIGGNNDNSNGHNNSDHNGMTIADNNSDNIVCNSNNDKDNDSGGTNIGEMSK